MGRAQRQQVGRSMRGSYLGRTPEWNRPSHSPQRRLSPKPLPNNRSHSQVSVHSEHLWNMMEENELFPDQIHQLLRQEERNLSLYKRGIEHDKKKVSDEFDNLKKQIVHNLDDLKISIHAELDRIYRNYMEKYATLKGQIMDLKRMKDELEMDIDRRNTHAVPKFQPSRTGKDHSTVSAHSNVNIMKSIEKNNFDVKKYQVLGYIAELQKEKLIPLGEVVNELVILSQYNNGYYLHKEFQGISEGLIEELKGQLRAIYERKYEFIREPQRICQKEEEPVLNGIYQEQHQPGQGGVHGNNGVAGHYLQPPHSQYQPQSQHHQLNQQVTGLGSHSNIQHDYQANRETNYSEVRRVGTTPQPVSSKLQESGRSPLALSPEQQNVCYDWGENVTFSPTHTIRSQSADIILCAIEVARGVVAVGGKDGTISVYELSSGQRVANLKGHKASICKLAMVQHNGRRYLASGSDHGCSSIVLWDTSSWTMRMKMESHKAAVTSIVDMMDNRSIVSGSYDKNIHVYNMNSEGKIEFHLPNNKSSVTGILLNCNGTKMVSCGLDNTLNVWQVARHPNRTLNTILLQRIIQNNTMVCSILASVTQPDLVILGAKDGKIKLINLARGDSYKQVEVGGGGAVVEMVAVERQSKQDLPIVVCWSGGEESMRVVNTDSGVVTPIPTKGFIEFGCGIGPKGFFVNGGREMAMLSQSRNRREVNVYKMDIVG